MQKKMKELLSELYVMKRTQNHTNKSKDLLMKIVNGYLAMFLWKETVVKIRSKHIIFRRGKISILIVYVYNSI